MPGLSPSSSPRVQFQPVCHGVFGDVWKHVAHDVCDSSAAVCGQTGGARQVPVSH
jgi:hypothetical protein